MPNTLLRRIAMPLLLVGSGQWLAQGFWFFDSGQWTAITLRRMLAELFNASPTLSGLPGDILYALLGFSPGGIMIACGIGLLVWSFVRSLLVERRNRRLMARHSLAPSQGQQRWTRADFRSAS